jgi:hypothetical protein
MSDFDPENIPVLDDIIDDDSADASELEGTENENNLDLFEENEAEPAAETESPIDTADNQADIDAFNEKISQLAVQYDYEEVYSGLAFRLDGSVKDEQTEVNTQDETDAPTTVEPLVLEPIIESVVKQMMPDLEQQLRFLIQQALEKRLPSEILKSTGTETDDNSTIMD